MPILSRTSIPAEYKQIAASPDTSPEQLRVLAAIPSKPICERVAANPNTPTDVLLKLGAKFPKQLLDNPVLPLLLLENPDFINDIPLNTLLNVLKQEHVPDYILNSASQHENEEVLILVASNINTSKTALEHLAKSRYSKVQEIAKLHVNLAGEIQEGWEQIAKQAMLKLNSDKEYEVNLEDLAIAQLIPTYLFLSLPNSVMRIIALHPDIPADVIEMLCGKNFWSTVHEYIVLNPKTPVNLIEGLVKYYNEKYGNFLDQKFSTKFGIEQVFSAIAKNPNTPIHILEELYQTSSHSILRAIAENPNAPVKLLDLLAEHPHTYIRSTLAQNPSTPTNSLKKLCIDQDEWVRLNVAGNRNIPTNLLNLLARDKDIKVRLNVASHLNASQRALELLAQDESEWVRCHVAKNPNIATNLLSVLAKEEGHSVRYYVARNNHTPCNLLKILAKDEHFLVRQAVASNPNTPLHVLKELVQDEHLNVHFGLATNPKNPQPVIDIKLTQEFPRPLADSSVTPANILTALAKHSDKAVRMSVARNKSTPEETLEILAKDRKYEVRNITAKNPRMCKEKFAQITLERIAKTSAPSFSRFIVFLHHQAPQQALAKNYRSEVWLERYAIAQNPNTPKHIISKLTLDANQIVRAAAKAALLHMTTLF